MKKLKYVTALEQVEGKIIEFKDGLFVLNEYGHRRDGEYDVLNTQHLSKEEFMDIFYLETPAEKVKRIHHFFRSAEYISAEVLNLLSEGKETEYLDVIDFSF